MASQGLSSGAWDRYGSGPIKEYEVEISGVKGLMPDLNAAIGREQLIRWPEMKRIRSEVFKVYEKYLGKKPEGHSQHIYAIQNEDRNALRKRLHMAGIGTGVHYNPLHLEPAYRFLGYKKGNFPLAESIGEKTVSLPLSSSMNTEEAFRVVEALKAR